MGSRITHETLTTCVANSQSVMGHGPESIKLFRSMRREAYDSQVVRLVSFIYVTRLSTHALSCEVYKPQLGQLGSNRLMALTLYRFS